MGVRRCSAAAVVVASLALAACGGGEKDAAPSGDTTADSAPVATSGGSSGGAVNDKQEVQTATVRIVASGSFRGIGEGQQAADWSGSGFIISPEGLVVTNQHVVEGAGSLEVYVDGVDRPKNAKILGVSECNDLAVIDLEGDGYPYVDWFQGDSSPGLDVWTAGFPLGDPEFTLARGSITKAEASGDTAWASLDYTLEHDARQEPGNSGGPLVDEAGHVVGINYAGGDVGGTGVEHYYSIPTALALPIIDVLKTGKDYDSVGVNGSAFYDEESGLAGVWVSGVRAGSPASDLNIKPGDVITDLGGRQVVTPADLQRDGLATKKGYCDVLRTQQTDRAIAIRVLRFDTNEVLSGELNNPDRPLELEASISNEVTGDTAAAPSSDSFSYTSVSDDTGRLFVEVPSEWSDLMTAGVPSDGTTLAAVIASTDVDAFTSGWTAPGIVVAISGDLGPADVDSTIDAQLPADCARGTRSDYETDYLTGRYEVLTDCGGSSAVAVIGAFIDSYTGAMVIVVATALEDRDLAAIDNALLTVYIAG